MPLKIVNSKESSSSLQGIPWHAQRWGRHWASWPASPGSSWSSSRASPDPPDPVPTHSPVSLAAWSPRDLCCWSPGKSGPVQWHKQAWQTGLRKWNYQTVNKSGPTDVGTLDAVLLTIHKACRHTHVHVPAGNPVQQSLLSCLSFPQHWVNCLVQDAPGELLVEDITDPGVIVPDADAQQVSQSTPHVVWPKVEIVAIYLFFLKFEQEKSKCLPLTNAVKYLPLYIRYKVHVQGKVHTCDG